MGKSTRPNPNPSEQVRIDVPYGYPVVNPPPPTTSSKDERRKKYIYFACVVSFSLAFAAIITYFEPENKLPRFQLDSVSVRIDGNSSTAAVLDIGFSIDTSFRDLTVWVRFMGRDYKVETAGSAGNTTVSLSTLMLPQAGVDYSRGGIIITLEQVMFRCNNYEDYFLEAACKDVSVFSSNETTTSGGLRLCPIVVYESI